MSVSIIIMVCSVFVASISQILLKISANKNHLSLFKEYFNLYVILGYILLFISTILTIVAFGGMDYKNGPLIESLGYLFVMILSYFILNEQITKKKIIGNVLILIGIFIYYI